jgi:hypothetical protein
MTASITRYHSVQPLKPHQTPVDVAPDGFVGGSLLHVGAGSPGPPHSKRKRRSFGSAFHAATVRPIGAADYGWSISASFVFWTSTTPFEQMGRGRRFLKGFGKLKQFSRVDN